MIMAKKQKHTPGKIHTQNKVFACSQLILDQEPTKNTQIVYVLTCRQNLRNQNSQKQMVQCWLLGAKGGVKLGGLIKRI